MEFIKYQHLERFGTSEVQNIELGRVFVFPKIDGTNASIWLSDDGELQAGSRRRHLTLEDDNAGFLAWASQQPHLIKYLANNPTHRLYGEWLVPHSLKTYRKDAWRTFYVFDVAIDKPVDEIEHEGASRVRYLPYEIYQPVLEEYGVNYIPPISIFNNTTYDQLVAQLAKNNFLIEDGKGAGEGVVIKNYGWESKYGRQTWAKIVTSEFKEKHAKTMGVGEGGVKKLVEESIAKEFVTSALCEKVYAKIENDGGFTQRRIPQLLNTVFYDVVKEDCWNFVKKFKNPTVNFSTLKHFVFAEVKIKMDRLF